MLHNSGGFGPGGNPSNTNLSEKTQTMCAPPNLGHNMANLSEIAQQQLRTSSERYDVPLHGSYNYELSSYNSNMGTFSSYQNRRLPDRCDPNTARRLDLNWEDGLQTHIHSVPFQNMPHFRPPFETPRISTDFRSQTLANSHIADHRNMDNYYDKYDRNKDNFNHYNQSFTRQELHKMDGTKQKNLENTVKLIENIISNSSNRNNAPQITNCNEKLTQEKCDDEAKNMLNGLLGEQGIQHAHYKQPSAMEINKQLERINPNKYNQMDAAFEHSINKDNIDLNKATECNKQTTENENNSVHKDATQDRSSVQKELNNSTVSTEKSKNKPWIEETIIKTNSSVDNKDKQRKSSNDDRNHNDLTNKHNETFLAKAELQLDNCNKIETEAVESENEGKSTGSENDYSAIFLRDPNKLSRKDVKKETVVNFVSSVEEAMACILKGTKPSRKCLYECEYCNHYFRHPKRFLIHVKWHTFGLTTASEDCQDIVRQQELEKRQCKPAQTRQCDFCEKKFKTLTSLTNHKQRFHRAERPERAPPAPAPPAPTPPAPPAQWVCAHAACRRVCTNKYTLAKHMRTHLEKHILCAAPQCGKLFATPAQLREHARGHERAARGPVYRCAHCPKGFYQTYNLHAHEKTHSNERPFPCDICGTRFATNSSLKRHLKVSHSASKPFPCAECGRCFAERRTLIGHASKAHPAGDTPRGRKGGKATHKTTKQSHPRKGKRGKKSKKAEDTSDGQEADMGVEYM